MLPRSDLEIIDSILPVHKEVPYYNGAFRIRKSTTPGMITVDFRKNNADKSIRFALVQAINTHEVLWVDATQPYEGTLIPINDEIFKTHKEGFLKKLDEVGKDWNIEFDIPKQAEKPVDLHLMFIRSLIGKTSHVLDPEKLLPFLETYPEQLGDIFIQRCKTDEDLLHRMLKTMIEFIRKKDDESVRCACALFQDYFRKDPEFQEKFINTLKSEPFSVPSQTIERFKTNEGRIMNNPDTFLDLMRLIVHHIVSDETKGKEKKGPQI